MKTNVLLAGSYLVIILLKLIPYQEKTVDFIIHHQGILPGLFVFFAICLFLPLTAFALALVNFRKPLAGSPAIRRTDVNLNEKLILIALWVVFVWLIQATVGKYLYFLNQTLPYFLCMQGAFLTFELIKKWWVKYAKPEFLSISSTELIFKSSFRKRIRKLDNLKSMSYETKQNAILLNFQDGIDNIKLHLTDYEMNDLLKLTTEIRLLKGDDLTINENFRNRFASVN